MKTWKTEELERDLLSRHSPGPERGGLVLDDGTVIELTNLMDEPEDGALLDPAELIQHEDRMVATWHTHPTTSANLSGMDWETFTNWPDQLHAIIGTDGIRWYRVKGRAVINA